MPFSKRPTKTEPIFGEGPEPAVGIWKQAQELVIMSESKSTGPFSLSEKFSMFTWADVNLIAFPFMPNAPWTTHQSRSKINKTRKLKS
jgi:hypothetical protein